MTSCKKLLFRFWLYVKDNYNRKKQITKLIQFEMNFIHTYFGFYNIMKITNLQYCRNPMLPSFWGVSQRKISGIRTEWEWWCDIIVVNSKRWMTARKEDWKIRYPRNEYVSRVRHASKENTKKLKCNSKIILGLSICILPYSV